MYGRFRVTQWDYILLSAQIISVQFSSYCLLGVLMMLVSLFLGHRYSISNMFQYSFFRVSEFDGRVVICLFVINSIISALLLWCIVKRAKQCLDFSCTFHGLHLLICWWYNSSFPSNLSWWLLNMVTCAIMCIGGEFLCLKSELNKIPVGYSALNEKSDV